MKAIRGILYCGICLISASAQAQLSGIRPQLEAQLKGKNATVGFALCDLETGDTLTMGNSHHYPMQSVYKFHLALAVLHKADRGLLSLDQKILISKKELRPRTWSPLAKKYPEGNITLSLKEILKYSVSYSDNNACDILFRLVGGTKVVDRYVQECGVKNISIKATEKEMHDAWPVQYTNWSTPFASLQLLQKFYQQKLLSKKSYDCLLEQMTQSENAPDRIKGKLPEDAVVAHKTGTSDRNKDNLKAATNDIGIVTSPSGRHFAIVVFVSDSKESDSDNALLIANLSKVAWDYFSH